ncbi:6-phosphofructokinase [Desulfobacula phenolica]|uniref:Pyrophosphate--fructose-6-phosphate 1-phosphotransferase n=1 Tax=Desulfobacula phenolica TaxID=90732 RepID=A0A1H2EWD4_9BACT|nr:6-phosphofructokinase [Desulfobacula phenolica]SDT99018.1 pyrophosphate--fructose-6-phosphate 1-phosphotransferase [Desulfobacula phenolica]
MENQNFKSLEFLLNHPKTGRVTSDINTETIERRSFSPKKIKIFSSKYTIIEDCQEYQFKPDKEAEKLLPDIINNNVQRLIPGDEKSESAKRAFEMRRNIGVVFSGGPAPGGHNVIAGLYDEAKKYNPESRIFGFLSGPDGILESKYIEITQSLVDTYRNMGGFSMIKTGRTKIDSKNKMELALKTCMELELDALVVIGGDDSNTNAAFLAQQFVGSGIKVIGVPKTIDGDIQVKTDDGRILCAISFGFHSAAMSFSQNISNLTTDAGSAIKYWHICKVMGRVASHLALECAFQTHANLILIGEELADYTDQQRIEKALENGTVDYTAYGMTLRHLSRVICDTIVRRAASGKNFGVMIIPEGVLEFINEIQVFIIKLNKIIAEYNHTHDINFHTSFPTLNNKLEYLRRLTRGMGDKDKFPIWNLRDDDLFDQLPSFFQEGLLVERDTHGNFQFSQVKTENIIMDMVKEYLTILKEQGKYKVGIEHSYFKSTMEWANIIPDKFATAIFKDPKAEYLIIKESIISLKTLKQALVSSELIGPDDSVPQPIVQIFKKSDPKFKTQTHFYGYDGRGADPTHFDCNYTYNLGMTAFHLIANGATGQMAAIRNLEKKFDKWEPIGIPIAKLMHLEERNGKLELVIEKSLVDLNSNAFRVFKTLRDKWQAAESNQDRYRRPGPVRFTGNTEDDSPIMLRLNSI